MKENDNNLSNFDDERTSAVTNEGFAVCGAVGMLYFIGRIFYVGAVKQTLAVPELVMIFVFTFIMWLNNRINKNFDFSDYGNNFDTSLTKKGKRSRMKKYLLGTIPFVLVMTALDIFTDDISLGIFESKILNVLLEFLMFFAIAFLIEYIPSERKVKRYNKYLDSLEDEDE